MADFLQTTGQRLVVFYFAIFFSTSLALGAQPLRAQTILPTTELSINQITVQTEIAATPASLQRGLMYRESLPANHGMLFVFNQPQLQCFWMKNTPLPLSIAFINQTGAIIHIADMQPLSEQTHCPPGEISYALEMEQGWFNRYGITTGAKVENLPAPN
ncbi:MAG TPA: hypothetical protein DEB15_02955 [Pusillimonas sp.]|jgi:uncharacterized membrane protein (UPF0127 family)|nr:hypothetical protein [Pusillimonas sp.]MBC41870.1 hypothetical protein [Pusillimonas sp.]HBT31853.1 hypothetical protein [Pusillimonas sp.]HCN71596.1 hypothetical protein [Pusillimonas sp.]HCP76674.1 hypothetical protein [Pusillimonas sp.]|tara:strand:- start:55550 stop:56026 length:477 start_codon:yes stop_codon:yes gene_type:complete